MVKKACRITSISIKTVKNKSRMTFLSDEMFNTTQYLQVM